MDTQSKKKLLQVQIEPSIELKLNEMSKHYGMAKAVLVRFAITSLYDGDYRKKVYGYQAGAATAAGRVQREGKRNERDNLVKSMNEMSEESLLAFLIEVGYIKQDEIDQQFNKTIHFSVHTDPTSGKELYRDYQSVPGTMESPTFYEDLDTIIKSLIKQKLI